MKTEKDYYQVLGISRNAPLEEIRKAYRTYATKYHPDKHDGDHFFEERFKEINEAYEILTDDDRRIKYDLKKFGRSRTIRKSYYEQEIDSGAIKKRRFRLELSHPDVYLTLFYAINLGAGQLLVRNSVTTSEIIWGLFFCVASALFMWRFIAGLIGRYSRKESASWGSLMMSLLLALLLGSLPMMAYWLQ